MFCPPEYVHIHKVLEVCKRAARVHLPIDEASENVYHTDDKTTLDPVKSKAIERKVIEQQMVKLALTRYSDNAFALSPRQQVVRLSHKIVSLTKPVWCISRSSDPHVRVELFYIDVRSGKIAISNLAERIGSWEGWSFKDEPVADFRERNLKFQASIFKEFGEIDGWTVCFDKTAAEFSVKDAIELWRLEYEAEKKNRKGRPRTQEPVRQVYIELFPDGHAPLKQKEVLHKIRETGQNCSAKTLQRVLNNLREDRGQKRPEKGQKSVKNRS